jgi:hypothetical protein
MDPLTIGLGLLKFAPMACKWLGGDKSKEAAQDLLSIAEDLTLKNGPDVISELESNPELALQFEEQVLKHEKYLDRIYLKDKQNARERDLKIRQLGGRNIRADMMILVVSLVLIVDIVLLWQNPEMPQGIVAILNIVVGSTLKMLSDAFQFEFGSSRSSRDKTHMIKG